MTALLIYVTWAAVIALLAAAIVFAIQQELKRWRR